MSKRIRLRYLIRERDDRGGDGELVLSVYRDHGVVPKGSRDDNFNKTPQDLSLYKRVGKGDLVVNKMKAWQGSLGVSDHEGAVSGDYLVCRVTSPEIDRRYLHQLLRSAPMVDQYRRRSTGIRPSQWRLYWEDFCDIEVELPPLDEQRAIADYLDAETARIDALIARKRQLIPLCEEQMAAYRDEMVWSAAHPLTPLMRIVQPERRIMYGIVLPGPDVSDGVLLVKGGNVKPGGLRPDLLARTSRDIEARYPRSRLQGGDLVFAIRGGVGDVEMVPPAISGANITQDVARIAPSPRVNGRYLLQSLRAPTTQRDVHARITGATIRGINIWELERVSVPLPSTAEQDRVARLLDHADGRHRRRLELLGRQIELLAEHRQALITAAVTGEFTVPGAA